MNKVIVYTRNTGSIGSADFANKRQREAALQAGILAGLISKDDKGKPIFQDVGMFAEPVASSDKLYKQVLATLEPMDCLIVASLNVFGTEPSKMVANLSKAIATGARLIVADMPEVNLQVIRQVALSFLPLEQQVAKLNAEIDALYANRQSALRTYSQEVQRGIMNQLMSRGIDLSALLLDADSKPAKKPVDGVRGKIIKRLREELSLTGVEAGQLVEAIAGKPLNQSQVSQIENGKDASERADNLETALRAEIAKRKAQQKAEQAAAATEPPAMRGQPPTELEKKFFGLEGSANG